MGGSRTRTAETLGAGAGLIQLPLGTGPSGWPSVASGPGRGSQEAHTGAPFPRGWRGAAAAADTPQGFPLVGVRNPYWCAGPEGSTPPLCPAARGSGRAFSNNHQGRDQCLRRGPSLACRSSGDRGSNPLPGRAQDPGASSSSNRQGQPHGHGQEQACPYIGARGALGLISPGQQRLPASATVVSQPATTWGEAPEATDVLFLHRLLGTELGTRPQPLCGRSGRGALTGFLGPRRCCVLHSLKKTRPCPIVRFSVWLFMPVWTWAHLLYSAGYNPTPSLVTFRA